MTRVELHIAGILMVIVWVVGILMGYGIGKNSTIDNLCNKSQYDFCQLVSKSFKIKEGFYNEN